jgi:hypothetical protein
MDEQLIEYQIVVNVYYPFQGGRSLRSVIRSSDRESAIKKYQYLDQLVKDKKKIQELKSWCDENLQTSGGIITSVAGLFGVSYIKILP